jgi:hypothetical protein
VSLAHKASRFLSTTADTPKNGESFIAVFHVGSPENYEKSIELNPKNQNGIDMLKKLKEQK